MFADFQVLIKVSSPHWQGQIFGLSKVEPFSVSNTLTEITHQGIQNMQSHFYTVTHDHLIPNHFHQ